MEKVFKQNGKNCLSVAQITITILGFLIHN